MGSLIEELMRRGAAARAEADRLRSRIQELSEDLARAEEHASRLAIASEEVTRVLEEPAAAEPEGAENLCNLGKGPAERGRAFGMRRAGLGPTGGGMIFGLWA